MLSRDVAHPVLEALANRCPKGCGDTLDTGYECNNCGFDALPLILAHDAAGDRGERMHPSGLYESEMRQ